MTWYAENSQVLLYLRVSNNKGGPGVAVAKTDNGKWSAPCSIHGNLKSGKPQFAEAFDLLFFVKNIEYVKRMEMNEGIDIGAAEDADDILAVTKFEGLFHIESEISCSIVVRGELNETMYEKVKYLDTGKILGGKLVLDIWDVSIFFNSPERKFNSYIAELL